MADRLADSRFRRMLLVLAAILVLGASLAVYGETRDARADSNSDDGKGLIEHPTGSKDVILRVELQGGFVPPIYALSRYPVFTLFGDGCYVVEGPMIEIFPAPALPNLQETCLTEEGVQEILKLAAEAGLMDAESVDIGDAIGDIPTTVFTVNANGKTYVTSAYALGEESEYGDFTAEEVVARRTLIDFRDSLPTIGMELPESMIAVPEHAFDIERLQLIVFPVDSPSAPYTPDDIEPVTVDWPLEFDLGEFGEPIEFLDGAGSGVVSGADLDALMDELAGSNKLTRWSSNGAEYILIALPLLPDAAGN